MTRKLTLKSRRLEAPNSLDAVIDQYYRQGWTDGLPIIPPTEQRVEEMVRASGLAPEAVMGRVAPSNGTATVEKVAINAVMAGCQPEHFPVVLAAVEAVCRPEFNVAGVQSTTAGASPLIILNGQIAARLDVNSDTGVFGNGYRANATIGRALRLVMRNLGEAIPGETDKSTLGHPGKYTMCIAENEKRNPWEPLHVELGYQPDASTITAVAVTSFHQISEMTVSSGREVLNTICSSLTAPGNLCHYVIGRETPLLLVLARIHRWTGMDGVRTAEGGEGVTGAMIRARIWVDGRLAGGLQALLGAPMAAYSGCGERDGGIGHGKRRSRTGLARVCGDVGLAGGSVADGRRQAGSGMARSRARARLNCSSQGQRRGRCRVNRRAERVIRPAKAKTRRLRVLVVTIC